MDEGDARAGVRRVDPDSRARTHLANERTFLAWLRTGLSLIALGLAAAQFLGRNLVPSVRLVTILSVLLVTGGVALTIVAGVRYARTRDGIDAGAFRPLGRSIIFAVALVALAGLLALGLVLVLRGLL